MSDKRATREGFYAGLAELGKERPDIIAVDADLPKTTGSHAFCTAFPDRYVNVGIAEQNLVGMSAGLARVGFVPFCSSMAVFAVGRAFEIIRNAVAYSRVNVKIVGSHGGITAAGDGATLWRALRSAGAEPCGLGSRDVLRLEAAYPLWGHEIDEDTRPADVGLQTVYVAGYIEPG